MIFWSLSVHIGWGAQLEYDTGTTSNFRYGKYWVRINTLKLFLDKKNPVQKHPVLQTTRVQNELRRTVLSCIDGEKIRGTGRVPRER